MHINANNTTCSGPNTSTPIKIGAIRVFVALPKTAEKTSPATNKTGRPKAEARMTPSVAPIEKSGVTSHP